jgi:hypothetical protein
MSGEEASGVGAGGPGAKPPAQQDGNLAPAVVALRMEDIAHWVVQRVAKMPREHKFAIGDKLVEACLDVTCALVEATYTPRQARAARAGVARARAGTSARTSGESLEARVQRAARILRARDDRDRTHDRRLDSERASAIRFVPRACVFRSPHGGTGSFQPRDPGGQLQQHRVELAPAVPQQQHPDESQQQHRVPVRQDGGPSCTPGRSESRRFHGRRERGDPQSTLFLRVIATSARSRTVPTASVVGPPIPRATSTPRGHVAGGGTTRACRRRSFWS